MMKNNRGQITITTFLVAFIGIITALVLFQGLSPFIGSTTGTQTLTNGTYTIANGSTVDLVGQELLSTPVVTNDTELSLIAAANYTIDEGVSATTGLKTIQFTWASDSEIAGQTPVNISYNYGADGYIESSGGRSIALLIPLFAALAIFVIALSPTLRSGIIERFGK